MLLGHRNSKYSLKKGGLHSTFHISYLCFIIHSFSDMGQVDIFHIVFKHFISLLPYYCNSGKENINKGVSYHISAHRISSISRLMFVSADSVTFAPRNHKLGDHLLCHIKVTPWSHFQEQSSKKYF